jgi:hypothetical protein
MSRSVVFNESVMFTNNLPSERVLEKELQHMRMQVEHVDDDIGVQVESADERMTIIMMLLIMMLMMMFSKILLFCS